TAISPRSFMRKAIAARSLSRGRIPPRLRGGWPSEARSGGLCRVGFPWASPFNPTRRAKARHPPRRRGGIKASLQAQRHEAEFAIRVSDKQERGLAAFLFELVDPLLQGVRIADRLLRHLDHHVARIEPLVGGGGLGFDASDHDALHAVLDLVPLAQV